MTMLGKTAGLPELLREAEEAQARVLCIALIASLPLRAKALVTTALINWSTP